MDKKLYATLWWAWTEMEHLLKNILEDGTGSIKVKKRVWPIRAAHHRQGRQLLNRIAELKKQINGDF